MHAFGRTLRRVGDLCLLALPGDDGRERYCAADGLDPLVTSPTLAQALAAFEAVRGATDEAAHRRRLAASGVVDLTASRLRRRRPPGDAPEGPRPPRAPEAEES